MNSTPLNFYSFFTKFSEMEEFGFSSGLIKRIFRKIIPKVPEADTIEYVLLYKAESMDEALSVLDLTTIADSSISYQLDKSIKALCTKIVAFGLDSDIKAKYITLALDAKPFETLLEKVNDLSDFNETHSGNLIQSLATIENLIVELRKNKNKIGTNFHLTLSSRRILEYSDRIKELLTLKLNIESPEHWKKMFQDYVEYAKNKDSISSYLSRNSDLVALEIVEHTSNKGEAYIAGSKKEYWNFFNRSLLGGAVIAFFAFFKVYIDSFQLSQLNYAYLFSINYALCFVIVKQIGGIIATKQPAMTASTIAKHIDNNEDLQIDSLGHITILIRQVFRSQFISIIGNFLMALTLASSLMIGMRFFEATHLIQMVEAEYLIDTVLPSFSLLFYAATAGFFLALSGLISGYVDNKVVDSNIAHRIRNNSLFFYSSGIARFFEKKAGALSGNISLGVFLGSAFLLSNFLPFDVDIRHIAFSSSYVGYSIFNVSFHPSIIALALSGALLIGFVNFIVSFSITLYLALKSRGANFRIIPKVLFNVAKDFLLNPLAYFIQRDRDPELSN